MPPRDLHREDARERLLTTALSLFANLGYTNTSTRALAEAAQVNVAAISYYFGDKAGLYRAVFFEPAGSCGGDLAMLRDPALALHDVLHQYYASFVDPLRSGEVARLGMKLRMREMLEPTGLWQEEITAEIRPAHDALAHSLAGRMGCAVDDDVHRLAICITALGVHLHVAHDVIDALAPQVQQGDVAYSRWIEVLVRNAVAMVHAEAARRGGAADGASAEERG